MAFPKARPPLAALSLHGSWLSVSLTSWALTRLSNLCLIPALPLCSGVSPVLRCPTSPAVPARAGEFLHSLCRTESQHASQACWIQAELHVSPYQACFHHNCSRLGQILFLQSTLLLSESLLWTKQEAQGISKCLFVLYFHAGRKQK